MATSMRTLEQLDLSVSGMTCGACAAKIEKGLNDLDGVRATVNFATESARIDFDPAQGIAGRVLQCVRRMATGMQAGFAHDYGAGMDLPDSDSRNGRAIE